jgi:hypothetical protein
MSEHHDPRGGLHSEQGAPAGENPGRAGNPIVTGYGLTWLKSEKPDLERAEVFGHAFGFSTASCTADELHTDLGTQGTLVRYAR